MSQEMEYPSEFGELGGIIARHLRGADKRVPTQEVVASRLKELLDEVRGRDQESNDLIAEYICNCEEWSSYTRDGTWNLHYCIDTFIPNDDGSVTYIMIDHEMPKSEADMDQSNVPGEQVREMMYAHMPRLYPEEELDEQDIHDFIVGRAKTAQVTLYKPDAIAYLKDRAVDETPMIDLLRLNYRPKRIVAPADESGFRFTKDRDDIYMHEILHSVVVLNGQVPMQSPERLLRDAYGAAMAEYIEDTVHVKEWHELYNRERYDESITEDERQAMQDRMREIMDGNGFPDIPFHDWRYVLPLEDILGKEVEAEAKSVWNQEVYEALLKDLAGNALYLESRDITIRLTAAQSVQRRMLAQAAYHHLAASSDADSEG